MQTTLRGIVVTVIVLALAACGSIQTNGPANEIELQATATSTEQVFPLRDAPPVDTTMRDETPTAWFVEFTGAPRARGGTAAALRNQRSAFAREAAAEGIAFRQRYDFGSLFNGVSVVATPSNAAKFTQLAGVKAIYPVLTVDAPQPESGTVPDMGSALGMTGADVAQNDMGLTGQGVKVAIIDSGMDLGHPDFAGRIVAGWDFVGDDYDASIPGNQPVPGPNPRTAAVTARTSPASSARKPRRATASPASRPQCPSAPTACSAAPAPRPPT